MSLRRILIKTGELDIEPDVGPRLGAASSSSGSSTVCGQFAMGSGLAARYSPARSAAVPQVSERATSRRPGW